MEYTPSTAELPVFNLFSSGAIRVCDPWGGLTGRKSNWSFL